MPLKNTFFRFSFLLPLFFLTACRTTEEPVVGNGKFPVTQPIVLDTLYTKDYVADIHSVRHVGLRARVRGYIEKIYTDEGKPVRQNEVLFRISSQEYQEELLKAKASLKSVIAEAKAAELDLQNVKTLVDKNVISKTEMEIAEAKVDALRAKIEEAQSHEASARLKLSLTEVRAPFSGIVDRIPYKAGSLVDEETLLTTISDNNEVFAYFHVSEQEYLRYVAAVKNSDRNKEVSLVLADNSLHSDKGFIETIEGEFDKQTGSIAFRARFPNRDKLIKHGSSGKVRLRQDLKQVMIIPQKSTFEIQDKIFVYVVNSENKIEIRSFVPRMRIPHLFIVETGLSVNDRIVYEGLQDIKNDMQITPEFISMRKIIPQLKAAQ